jgi:DHA3 family macrolide efflux protein-like MFS transporter
MKLIALLRRPGPRLLWSGQVTSATGDRLYGVALIWITLRLTGSPAAVGLVTLADTLPFLATSLVSGALADRRDALRLARAVNLAQALIVAIIPAAYLAGHLDVPVLAAVACLLSALEAFCLPSLQASLPRLVEPRALTPMVSLLDSTDRLARVLGPGAISLLVVIVPEVHLFSLDAASFAVSAFCLSRVLRYAAPPAGSAARGNSEAASEGAAPEVSAGASGRLAASLAVSLVAGWQVIWRHATIRNAAVLRAACNLAWPAFTIGVPFLVADRYHRGLGGYGLVLGAFGVGNLAGNLLSGRIGESRLLRWCCVAWGLCGLGFAVMAQAPLFWLFVLASAAVGVCTPLANVTVDAYIARTVDQALLARVYATQRFLVVAAGAAGLPVAALFIRHLGAGAALTLAGTFVGCAAITCAAVAALIRREVTPQRPGRPGRLRRPGTAGESPCPPAAR